MLEKCSVVGNESLPEIIIIHSVLTVFQAEKYSGLKHGLTLKSFGTDAERPSEGPLQLPHVCK
jgi:hypothetical protein